MSCHTRAIALSALAMCALAACKPAATTPAADAAATPASAPSPGGASKVARIAAALNPLADPKDAIKASMEKFLAAHSYHATMQVDGGAGDAMGKHEIDFVAPDRYRMQIAMGTQVIIGDTMYMSMQGRTMKVPMPKGTLSQWHDPAKLAENEADMTVQAQGSDTVDGVRAKKYVVHHTQPQPTDVTMWIGNDDLPIRMQVASVMQGRNVSSTIRYSRFDDPTIRIDPPK